MIRHARLHEILNLELVIYELKLDKYGLTLTSAYHVIDLVHLVVRGIQYIAISPLF